MLFRELETGCSPAIAIVPRLCDQVHFIHNQSEIGSTKCLEAQTDLLVHQRVSSDFPEMSVAELLLYNMRHVQEHATQLSLFLGQQVGSAPGWVAKAK